MFVWLKFFRGLSYKSYLPSTSVEARQCRSPEQYVALNSYRQLHCLRARNTSNGKRGGTPPDPDSICSYSGYLITTNSTLNFFIFLRITTVICLPRYALLQAVYD
jgi:hypothetical protein